MKELYASHSKYSATIPLLDSKVKKISKNASSKKENNNAVFFFFLVLGICFVCFGYADVIGTEQSARKSHSHKYKTSLSVKKIFLKKPQRKRKNL